MKLKYTLLASLVLAGTSAHAASLLVNGDFEVSGSGAVTDWTTISGWDNTGAGSVGVEDNAGYEPNGGSRKAYFGDTSQIEQSFTGALAGGLYTVSFTEHNNWNAVGATNIAVTLYEGTTALGSWTGPASGPNLSGFVAQSFTTTVPSTASATLRLEVTVADSWVHMDDFEVNAIPEPSSTALLGLGGLALIMRRRK